MANFADPFAAASECIAAMEKPRRVSVSQGASDALVLSDASGYSGPWDSSQVPYLIKPMDCLASRHYEAVCYVGPARSGKTAGLILGWLAHNMTNDIGRMMVMHMTEKKAIMLSKLDVDPAIESSPKLRVLRSARAHDDNIGLKIFKNGMAVRFAHPSPSELAGTTYRYVALTDYDRFPRSVAGGEVFDTAHKRTETLMSRRMTMVESSPERRQVDPHWKPQTPHEAPPVGGVLGIYNRGDRHRWYWKCIHCGEDFEASPGLELFASLPPFDDLAHMIRGTDIEALVDKHAVIFCPHCGAAIEQKYQNQLNADGRWINEAELLGRSSESTIASFWQGGVAASYQTWRGILGRYLQAVRDYAMTGSDDALESSTYTDQAMPYLPPELAASKIKRAEELAEDFERYIVPADARFLVASVDVQGGRDSRFVVQVHAHGPNMEQWLVDRYSITDSTRENPEGGFARIDPASHAEDWDILTDKVVAATYRTTKDGEELRVHAIIVDSGGEDGVTENAYAWWARTGEYAHKIILYKGASTRYAPIIKVSKVGTKSKGGDVPILLCNANLLKDAVDASWRREDAGPGKLHLPLWLGAAFWDELKAEIRKPDGTWKKIRTRNESIDLAAMNRAAVLYLGADRLNWNHPPAWARPIGENSERMTRDERREMKSESKAGFKKSTGFKKKSFC